MVVAQSRGQAELVGEGEGPLAEESDLAELVVQGGEEEGVLGRSEPLGGNAGGRVETRNQQVLPVLAPRVGVEGAADPLEAVLPAGQAEFLAPRPRRGRVVERGVQRVNLLGQADRAARDRAGQRGRVAQHVDVAMGVGGDGRQEDVAEVVLDVDVPEHEVVGGGLVELCEELSVAERHLGAGRRVGIGQDVEDVDPVPAVHLHRLVEEARNDGELVARGELECSPHARAVAGVDVLLDAQVQLDRIHPAGKPFVIRREAHRGLVAQGSVEARLGAASLVAAVDGADGELAEVPAHAELGLVADVANRAAFGTGAEQSSLRAAQHFDAGHVEEIDVRREEGQGNRGFVQVGTHGLLDSRLIARDLAGGNTAQGDLILAGSEVLYAETGHVGGHLLEVLDSAFP